MRKITLGRCLIRLHDTTSGKIIYDGKDITHIQGEELRDMRRKMQIIFQDPYASLNPRMTIGAILEEPLVIHNLYKNAAERAVRVRELIDLVGLRPESLNRYPHEFRAANVNAWALHGLLL